MKRHPFGGKDLLWAASALLLLCGSVLTLLFYIAVSDNKNGIGPGPEVAILLLLFAILFIYVGASVAPLLHEGEAATSRFRIGAIYEKIVEVKTGDQQFISILKDSKGAIFAYKSPRSLPDKFFATEDYEIMPFAPVSYVDAKERTEETQGGGK